MNITLSFKSMSLTNEGEVTLSIAPSAMQKMIMELLANGYLTTEDLVVFIIGQLKVCDQISLSHVLPETIINQLTTTYESVKNGEDNV